MAFDPAAVPFLVPHSLDSSYGVDSAVVLRANPLFFNYNFNLGYFTLEPAGNLEAIGSIVRQGLVAITTPGSAAVAVQFAAGNGLALSNTGTSGADITFSAVANTTVQKHILNVGGVEIGTAQTIDFIAGDGIDILGTNNGFENQVTLSATTTISDEDYFVVTRTAADLANSTNLGALTTGLLKNTVSGGAATLSRAVPATTSTANDYQAGSAALSQIAALSPSSGQSIYYTGGAWTAISGMAFLGTAQTWTGIQTFTPKTIFTNSIQIPLGAANTYVLTSDASGNASWSAAGSGNVTLAGANVFTGTNTFNTALPTSTVAPTLATQLVTKAYTDATFGNLTSIQTWSLAQTFSAKAVFTNSLQIVAGATNGYVLTSDASGNASWSANGTGDVLLAGANAFTGTNTFNTNLPTSTLTPSSNTQLITKVYADTTYGTLGGVQTWTGVNTFSPQTVFTNSIKIPLGAGAGLVLSSDASGNATWTSAGAGNVTLAGVNNFTGTNSFNVNLPTSTVTPTANTELITKVFADTTYGRLASANTWTSTNTFNVSLPTSTVTPTTSTQLITKAYGDATYATIAGAITLAGTNAWTGTNTYNTNLPTSTLTPSSNTQLITKVFADTTYGRLASANAWTSTNTFNTSLPTSTVTPTTATQLTTKLYVDSLAPTNIAAFTTTDATPTNAFTVSTGGFSSVVSLNGRINAASIDWADACGGTFTATALFDSGTGNYTMVGTPSVVLNSSTTASFNVIVSGSTFALQVTGLAGLTYNWHITYFATIN